MILTTGIAEISRMFRQRFLPGTTVHVLPGNSDRIAQAARMAGMNIAFRAASLWPFPDLIDGLSRRGTPGVELVGRDEIAQHNAVRDFLVTGIRSAPGGAAIIEVPLRATMSALRADADIVARSPRLPGAAGQVFFEVKTGRFSEIRPNQGYVYSLALIGQHVRSEHPGLQTVGLVPGAPLPPMDFILAHTDPRDRDIRFALILASQVAREQSLAQIMAHVEAVRSAP
ncbi:hypothetical protein GXW71_18295 [Roseomonas hellenica]|uniref:Uncharacterized protein n=1 Tax=Plastoroseomonas hellenica TaxID=2687306 RepID=A0ABS5F164_9PROT|nr:hypothetical protein [Plastoroseomonas hellenica]MBR0666318.1 hypothetical protein [Plastoroseomonas hellenica]